MKKKRGLTALEFAILGLGLIVALSLLWLQYEDIRAAQRDSQSKTTVNALHTALEEVYHPAQKSYPRQLSRPILLSVEKEHFKDPFGQTIGGSTATIRYEPNRCNGDKCRGYSLRALLEKEADFVKENRY